MEVLWLTDMLETLSAMKGRYRQYACPHCCEGRDLGTLETPQHLMQCEAYLQLRQGLNPEEDLVDRSSCLRKVMAKRKELESELMK